MHSRFDTCKGRRQELVHFEKIIYHRDRDRDKNYILVSQDVCGRWVARCIFWESYQDSHLTGSSSCVDLIPKYSDCFYSTLLHSDLELTELII